MVAVAALGALLAALCYGTGAVLQAVAARRQGDDVRLDLGLALRLARQGPYVGGLALDAVGFLASLVALRSLPLFLVQSVVASSVGVTALLAWRFLGVRPSRADRVGVSALVVGLCLLAVSARAGPARGLSSAAGWLVVAGPAVSVAGALLVVRGRAPVARAAGLAAASGVAFAGVAVAARGVALPHPVAGLLTEPLLYAVLGYGVLGVLLFAAALQRGSVVLAVAITFAVETVLPAAVGLTLLGDSTRPGLGPVAVLGFVVTLGAAISLARHAEPETAASRGHPG